MAYKNKEEYKAYQKAYREANKEKNATQRKVYYEANKEKIAEKYKAYREANKEKIAERHKAWHKVQQRENADEYLKKKRAYYKANKDKFAEKRRVRYEANKEERNLRYRQRYDSDRLFKLSALYRRSCHRAFQSIGDKKNNRSLKLLGLETWQELAKHLQSQFYDHPDTGKKMTFDNHGFYGWHIDHIIPMSTAETEEDIIKLCHYTNLQPLWAEDNLKKSNKILDTE